MMIIQLTIVSAILQTVYMLPVNTNKREKKRSIDFFLKPFDIEYKPLEISHDVPVSFQETTQFWNSLVHAPVNQGIELGETFSGEFKEGFLPSIWNDQEEYHDPYLLKGLEAKRAALILYSKELFFGDYPHEKALLLNQEKRKLNGLSGNTLGSLRPSSPFSRGRHNF